MAQPRTYTQTTTFTDHSTVSPDDPHSGANLDVEFVEVKQTLDDLNTNIALLQRDDGKLSNQVVHKDSFDQDALALVGATGSGFNSRGDWATATTYVAGDLVTNNAATYLATTATHVSGATFAGDLAAQWQLIANSAIETTSASINMHNGTGSQTLFTTLYTYTNVGDIQVFVNGALQATTAYSITNSGGANNITITAAPPSGTNNVIIWGATVVAEAAKQGSKVFRDTAGNHATTAERWSDKVDGSVVDADTSVDSSEYSAKAYAVGGTGVTTSSGKGAAKQWATTTGGQVDTAEYSAKEYATGTTAPLGSSKSWATKDTSAVASSLFSAKEYASGSSATGGTAKEWATKDDGEVISGVHSAKAHASVVGSNAPSTGSAKEWATTTGAAVDTTYSSKEYAQGSVLAGGGSAKNWSQLATTPTTTATDASAKEWATGTSTHKNDGSAKSWATVTGAVVTGSEYSAKEYALGTTVAAGSAKDWAVLPENDVVDGGSGYSSLHHAAKSSASATAAAASETSANASADAVSVMYDAFHDKFLGSMADGATQGTNPTPTGQWLKNSSTITVSSNTNIKVGQIVVGAGIETSPVPNVISIDGTAIVISDNMAAVSASSTVALTFTGHGIYGTFHVAKDGPALNNDGVALTDGLLYFNTSDDTMKVYDVTSTSWKRLAPTTAEQGHITTVSGIQANVTTVAGISGNVTTVAGISTDITQVVGELVYKEDLGGIADAVTTSTGNNITDVADNETNINAVAGKVTEIGRLGTAAAVADMALLGLAPVITDMDLLGATGVIADMDAIGATGVIDDLETVANSSANVATVAGISGNVTTVAGISANTTTVAGISANVTTVAGVSANVTTVAGSIADVNRYAAEYTIASSAPGSPSEGDLWYDSSNNVLKYHTGSAFSTIASGIGEVSEDTTPQLGGNLDAQTHDITSVGTISGTNLNIDFGSIA